MGDTCAHLEWKYREFDRSIQHVALWRPAFTKRQKSNHQLRCHAALLHADEPGNDVPGSIGSSSHREFSRLYYPKVILWTNNRSLNTHAAISSGRLPAPPSARRR